VVQRFVMLIYLQYPAAAAAISHRARVGIGRKNDLGGVHSACLGPRILFACRVDDPRRTRLGFSLTLLSLRQSQAAIRPRIGHDAPRELESFDCAHRFVRAGVDHDYIV
jgi:hypothetical protein